MPIARTQLPVEEPVPGLRGRAKLDSASVAYSSLRIQSYLLLKYEPRSIPQMMYPKTKSVIAPATAASKTPIFIASSLLIRFEIHQKRPNAPVQRRCVPPSAATGCYSAFLPPLPVSLFARIDVLSRKKLLGRFT